MMSDPVFLTLDQVLEIHRRQIERFGGSEGVRDISLIESALFHLVSNHGFVDGNKRVGAAAALVFLELNGIDTDPIDEEAMGSLTLAIAAGQADKSEVAQFFLPHTQNA